MPVDPFLPAHRLAASIRQRKLGCVELLDLYLARIERYNPQLNAVIVLDAQRARKRARAADRALAKGEVWGPLHGVPMTIKESFDVAGLPTTWGRPELKDNIPTRDALAVQRLEQAGAVLFGKTNVPRLLADWQTFNPIHGTTNNPWDLTRVPGGSSGGAAAALAAGLTGLETGSDIGASIRNPAHYCGVYGHKPTYAICSSQGQVLPPYLRESDISVIGPLARSARDLELSLKAIAGPDESDARGWQLRLPRAPRKTWRQWKVGVLLDAPNAEVDRSVQERIQALADFLGKRGAKVEDRARPAIDLAEAHRVFVHLLRAATTRSLTDESFARQKQAAAMVDPADDGYYPAMLRANTMHHRDWLYLNEKRHRMRLEWAAFFENCDLLLCPAAATPAFPHDQQGERWERMVTVNGKRRAREAGGGDVRDRQHHRADAGDRRGAVVPLRRRGGYGLRGRSDRAELIEARRSAGVLSSVSVAAWAPPPLLPDVARGGLATLLQDVADQAGGAAHHCHAACDFAREPDLAQHRGDRAGGVDRDVPANGTAASDRMTRRAPLTAHRIACAAGRGGRGITGSSSMLECAPPPRGVKACRG